MEYKFLGLLSTCIIQSHLANNIWDRIPLKFRTGTQVSILNSDSLEELSKNLNLSKGRYNLHSFVHGQ